MIKKSSIILYIALVVLLIASVKADDRTYANQTLSRYERQLNTINQNISIYSSWLQDDLKSKLDYSNLKNELSNLRNEYNIASTNEEFSSLVSEINNIQVPSSIYVSSNGTLPLIVGADSFDITPLEQIEGKEVDENLLRKAIVLWMNENARAQADFATFDVISMNESTTILTYFKIETKLIDNNSGDYFVISYPTDQINFASDYGVKSTETASYISLGQGNQIFEFAIPGDVKLQEIGPYVAPTISRLGDFEQTNTQSVSPTVKVGFVLISLLIIILLGGAGYFIIHWWYKTKYESTIFSSKRDVATLLGFIKSSRMSRLDDAEIRRRLKKSGWNNEQINYGFHKIGKDSNDARFIKRP